MKIKYVHKMGDEEKPFLVIKQEEIPENIMQILLENNSFNQSATFGEKGLGEPDEIEILNVKYDDGEERRFIYYNKGIHYLMNGDEDDQPVFQVFTYFMMKE